MSQDKIQEHNDVDGTKEWTSNKCKLCGWSTASFRNYDSGFGMVTDPPWNSQAILRNLDVDSAELRIDELGTYLRKNFSDIYALPPKRFEELIKDVFQDSEHESFKTQQTRDGGLDVYLVNRATEEIDTVIECKRYHADRRVGIQPVQRIAGVAVEWSAQKAILVTSSDFTKSAKQSAKRISASGLIEVDLVSATQLLRMMSVYNTSMPDLHQLTPEMRAEISRTSGKTDALQSHQKEGNKDAHHHKSIVE